MTDTDRPNPDWHRRLAATLLLVTSVLWLHEWLSLLLVVAWVAWMILHTRLEGEFGEAALRLWRRAWPPHTLLLIPLLAANAFLYAVYAPVPGKILPIALNVLGLSVVLGGAAGALFVRPGPLQRVAPTAGTPREPVSTKA